MSDLELVALAQDGDNHAFDHLVCRYQHKVNKIVNRYVTDPSEALDLTQEIFLKVYTALTKFRGDSAFYTWLYRVAINTAKNYVILKGRRPPLTDMDIDMNEQILGRSLLKDYSSPEHHALSEEIQSFIFDAVDNMGDDARLAFVLREMEGFSYEDIADVLDCPVGTIRSRIFRAREAIDREISDLLQN